MATTETSTNTFVKKRERKYFVLRCSSFAEVRAFRFVPQAVNLALHGVLRIKLYATKS